MTDTAFYTGLRATADRLLQGKGKDMTLRKRTPGTYSETTGTVTVTTADHAVTAAEFDYPRLFIDGTMILQGDRKVVMSAEGVTVSPEPDDQVISGDTTKKVVTAKPIAPGGIVVAWILQVRS